jgi:hypothetical protein
MRLDLRLELQQQRRPTREQRLAEIAAAVKEATRLKARFDHARAMAHSQARAADRAKRLGLEAARKLAGSQFEAWLRTHNL